MPLSSIISVYLATCHEQLREEIASFIADEAKTRQRKSKHVGVSALVSRLKRPLGNIIPFEANQIDLDLLQILAYKYDSCLIYSTSSLLNAGALRVSKQDFQYFDHWFDDKASVCDITIVPNCKQEVRKRIAERKQPRLSVEIERSISIKAFFNNTRTKPIKTRRESMSVSLFDPNLPNKTRMHSRSLTARYVYSLQCIELMAATPEAMLQLSAYSADGLWVVVNGDAVSATFPIPDLDDLGSHSSVWTNDWDRLEGYLNGAEGQLLDIPIELAVACAHEFNWFSVGSSIEFTRLLAQEHNNP